MALAKRVLSGSTHGRAIKIAATSTPGTTIHTATSESAEGRFDEIYLFATNTDSSARTVTIEWGGTTSPDDLIVDAFSVPASVGPVLIVSGLVLRNSLVVRAFASAANVVLISGFVHRN